MRKINRKMERVHLIICAVDSLGMIRPRTGFRIQSLTRVGTAMNIAVPIIIRVRGKRRIFSRMVLGVDFIRDMFAYLTPKLPAGYHQI